MSAEATRIGTETLVKNALMQDSFDRFFQAAFLKLTRHLKRAPGGRRAWIFYQASHGTYKPWKPLVEAIRLAMAEPDCQEDDAMAIVHCLAGLVHAHYAAKECEVATVKEALRLSISTDTEEIAAQADALANPSDANIERVIEKTSIDDRADRTLLTLLRGVLATNATRPRAAR